MAAIYEEYRLYRSKISTALINNDKARDLLCCSLYSNSLLSEAIMDRIHKAEEHEKVLMTDLLEELDTHAKTEEGLTKLLRVLEGEEVLRDIMDERKNQIINYDKPNPSNINTHTHHLLLYISFYLTKMMQ
jgi:hypothetical protein